MIWVKYYFGNILKIDILILTRMGVKEHTFQTLRYSCIMDHHIILKLKVSNKKEMNSNGTLLEL